MGSNRRYGSDVSDSTLERLNSQGPTSLYREETGDVVTAAPVPVPVQAWVRFGAEPIRVPAEAIAWTPRAVRVRFSYRTGDWDVWVWASAVERR